MADKIKAIKIKQQNGTYTGEIPISVNVQNVQWDENNHTLLDALGSVDISSSGKGNLQHQIDELDGDKISTNEFNSRLNDFLREQISADTTDWLDDNVNPVGSAVIVDKTLTIEGAAADALAVKTELNKKADASNTYTKAEVNAAIDAKQIEVDDTLSITGTAADAKAVGDELTAIKADLSVLENSKGTGFSVEARDTLLKSLTHNLWLDDTGRDYYDSLYKALYGEMKYEWNRSYGLMEENGFILTSGTTELRNDGEYLNGTLVMPQYYSANTKAFIEFTPFSLYGAFSVAIGGKGARIEYDNSGTIMVMVANERITISDRVMNYNQRHSVSIEYTESGMTFWLDGNLIYTSSSLSTLHANYTTINIRDGVIHNVKYEVTEDLIYRWVPSDGKLLQNGFHHYVSSDKNSAQNLSKEKLQMLVGNGTEKIILNKDVMDKNSSIDYVILMNAYGNRIARAVFSLSNGEEGIRVYLYQENINDSYISVYVMNGNTNTKIQNVTLELNKIYLVKLEYSSSGTKVYIGNDVIYESNTYSTSYVSAPTISNMGGELDLYSIRQRRFEA